MGRSLARLGAVVGALWLSLLQPASANSQVLAQHVEYDVGSMPAGLATGDLDGDGNVDIVSANVLSQDVSVLLGRGDGTFAAQVRYPAGGQARSVAIGDVDKDGDLDLAIGLQSGGSTLAVMLNDGAGSFSTPQLHGSPPETPNTIILAHLDGDADLDAAMVCGSSGEVLVFRGRTGADFHRPTVYAVPSTPVSGGLAAGDVDQDGDLDLIASFIYSSGTPAVLLNQGNGAYVLDEPFNPANTNTPAVGVGPLDGQSGLDIVQISNMGVVVFPNDGAGTFGSPRTFDPGVPTSSVTRLFLADLDVNGSPDLLITGSGFSVLGVLLNDGTGGFGEASQYATGAYNADVVAADLNGDNFPDVIASNRDGHSVSVMLNLGAVTSVGDGLLQRGFELWPNPTRATTIISYHMPEPGRVAITVHDIGGRLVRALSDVAMAPGARSLAWDGRASNARPVPAGVYLVRLEAAGLRATRRVVLLP